MRPEIGYGQALVNVYQLFFQISKESGGDAPDAESILKAALTVTIRGLLDGLSEHLASHVSGVLKPSRRIGRMARATVSLERTLYGSRLSLLWLPIVLPKIRFDSLKPNQIELVKSWETKLGETLRELGNVSLKHLLLSVGECYQTSLNFRISTSTPSNLQRGTSSNRKSSGTYFTPEVLVQFVLKSTLKQLVSSRQIEQKPIERSSFCDPACGDGRFLRAIAFEMIKRSTEHQEPNFFSGWLDACLHGVDLDPNAVEITRSSLFMIGGQAVSLIAPLTENILCGDSLFEGLDELGAPAAGRKTKIGLERLFRAKRSPCVFDAVIGNPPWDKLELLKRENIASNHSSGSLSRLKSKVERQRAFVRSGGHFSLTHRGRINRYLLFVEVSLRSVPDDGVVSLLVPSGVVTDQSTATLVQYLRNHHRLSAIYDFDNRGGFFKSVQGNVQFCCLVIASSVDGKIRIGAKLRAAQQGYVKRRTYLMPNRSVDLMMPLTGNIPLIASRKLFRLIKQGHQRFLCAGGPEWGLKLKQGSFNMTTAAGRFMIGNVDNALPLYEAKYVHQYNHRFADFRHRDPAQHLGVHPSCDRLTTSELMCTSREIAPRFSITYEDELTRTHGREWHLVVRNVFSSVADSRSVIASVIPQAGVGNSLTMIQTGFGAEGQAVLLCLLNSYLIDFLVREKSTGSNLNFFVIQQIPLPAPSWLKAQPSPDIDQSLWHWLAQMGAELAHTSDAMTPFFKAATGRLSTPTFDKERRRRLRAEVDAMTFRIFNLSRADLELVFSTFPVQRRLECQKYTSWLSRLAIEERFDSYRSVDLDHTARIR